MEGLEKQVQEKQRIKEDEERQKLNYEQLTNRHDTSALLLDYKKVKVSTI